MFMDLDSFLALPRWDILRIIAERPSSPIKIAEQTKTTVSYVSQQLKLLEAKGLVEKKKTGAFEKGQPRNIFSISQEFVHLTILSNGFAEKKKVGLDERKKIILRIWLLEDLQNKEMLEKLFFFTIFAEEFDAIFLDLEKKDLTLILISKDPTKKIKVDSLIKKLDLKINSKIISPDKLEISDSLYLLHENAGILKTEKQLMKGGNE